jgi:hypothetical protein
MDTQTGYSRIPWYIRQLRRLMLVALLSPHFSVRRERRRFSVGANPIRQLSLQPVAIGAVADAMKPLKPPMERIT